MNLQPATSGFGGPLCEGKLHNMALSYDSDSGELRPGEWAYFVMDPEVFDSDLDTMTLQWVVHDNEKGALLTDYYNAMFTATMWAFPRQQPLESHPQRFQVSRPEGDQRKEAFDDSYI